MIENEIEKLKEFVEKDIIEQEMEDKCKLQKLQDSAVFVFDDSNQPQLIDHALGYIKIDGKMKRYFGVKMLQKHTILVKEKSQEITTEEPAIITEDRQIISAYRKPAGVDFRFETVMSLKRNRWAKEDFEKFLYNPKYDISYKEAYTANKKVYDDNMCYEDPTIYKFNAVMDLLSYHTPEVDKALIRKYAGLSGSAKSKGMRIGANLSFNGRKWIKPTPANFFRYRHLNKATLFLDEVEKLFDEKNKSSSDSDLVEYLNSGYEQGNLVPRQNDKNLNQTDEFDPFGFTNLGSIKPLQGPLKNRSITQQMTKAKINDIRSNREILPEMGEEYIKCREKSYVSCLLHYTELLDALNTIENTFGLANREWNIAKPVIALAFCIDKELATEIGNYIAKSFYVRDGDINESSWNYILSEILIKHYCTKRENMFISNTILKTQFSNHVKIRDEYKNISSIKLSSCMTEIGLGDYKTRNSKGDERGYLLSFAKICEIITRNGIMTPEDVAKIMSEVSDCQYDRDPVLNIASDINLTTISNEQIIVREESIADSDTLTTLTNKKDKPALSKTSLKQYLWNDNSSKGVSFDNIKNYFELTQDDLLLDLLTQLRNTGDVISIVSDHYSANK